MQTVGDQGMGVFVEHGDILFYLFSPSPCGRGTGRAVLFKQRVHVVLLVIKRRVQLVQLERGARYRPASSAKCVLISANSISPTSSRLSGLRPRRSSASYAQRRNRAYRRPSAVSSQWARLRIPPSGKIPVAASASFTLANRPGRSACSRMLLVHSAIKCGITTP